MTTTRIVALSLASVVLTTLTAGELNAQSARASKAHAAPGAGAATISRSTAKPVIVLVHGAFADATGWQRVIAILERDGYTVVAVQNSLASLAGDVETTKRFIEAQPGSVVAVGHSYGGAVITGAAAGNPNVKALVYLAAFGPEVGEPVGAYLEQYPSLLGTGLAPDAAGFVYIDREKFKEIFAKDVDDTEM